MDRGRISSRILSRISVKYLVEYRILADFISIKVEFLHVYIDGSRAVVVWILAIFVYNTDIRLEVESNIRSLFDLLLDPK